MDLDGGVADPGTYGFSGNPPALVVRSPMTLSPGPGWPSNSGKGGEQRSISPDQKVRARRCPVLRRVLGVVMGTTLLLSIGGPAFGSNTNGSGGDMPAYYDGSL